MKLQISKIILTGSILSAVLTSGQLLAQSSAALEPAPAASSCERSCLTGFIDNYFTSMLAKDSSGIPVSRNVKVTQNAEPVKLGEGYDWKNARKFFSTPSSTQYVADSETGQIARMGVIDLDGEPAFHAVRIKVDNDQITEIETLIGPQSIAAPFQPEGYIWREAPYIRPIPMAIRSSRAELLKTAGTYWSVATSTHVGTQVPYSVDCVHLENGMNTGWERPLDNIEAMTPTENPQSLFDGRIWTCEREVNLTTRTFEQVRGLRYLVDEERGLVMAWNIIDKNNVPLQMPMEVNGVQRTPPAYGPQSRGADGWPAQRGAGGPGGPGQQAPGPVGLEVEDDNPSLYHAALFRIVNGKIHREQFFQVDVPRSTAAPF